MPNNKPFVFVLMPFSDELRDTYESGIKLACKDAGVTCTRVDEQNFDETILQRIFNQIREADAVVADMTGRNLNVFYEVGFAHASNKRVILLTKDAGDIPFDLKHHQHIVYEGKSYLLREQLTKKLRFYFPPEDEIHNASSSSQTIRRITRILAHVSNTLGDQPSLQLLLNKVVLEMMQIFDAEVCSIFLNTPEEPTRLRCVAASGFASPLIHCAEYESGEGLTGTVFQERKTTLISSVEDLDRQKRSEAWKGKYDDLQWGPYEGKNQYRNGIATPLAIGDQSLGVIKIENKRAGTFTQDDVEIVEAITNGALSLAIHNARLAK